MTCPITVRLGVYALGAADEAERVLIGTHLATCQDCQTELARLEPLPGLLARVPAHLIRTDLPPASLPLHAPAGGRVSQPPNAPARNAPARKARAAAGRWRGAVAAAVAAVALLGAAGGFWLAQPGASPPAAAPPPAAITLSGTNPVTHVRVTVTLTGTSWGTSIRLLASGLPVNQPCRLIVRSRSGGTEVAGTWDAWRAGQFSIPASAGWRPTDIASLQVTTTSRNLVTVNAAGTHGV